MTTAPPLDLAAMSPLLTRGTPTAGRGVTGSLLGVTRRADRRSQR